MADLTTVRLSTAGMHCGSCAMLIDLTLGELDGVREVTTDYASGISSVTFDPASISVEDLVASVRAAGYDAVPE